MWLLLLLPNFILLIQKQQLHVFALSLLIVIYAVALIRNSRYLFVFLPFFILIPALVYYIYFYQALPSEQIFSIILESNWQETTQFLGSNWYLYILFCVVWLLLCSYGCLQSYRSPRIWQHRSRWWVLAAGTLYFLMMLITNQQLQDDGVEMPTSHIDDFLANPAENVLEDLKKTYPLGVLIAAYDLKKEQNKINQAFDRNSRFKFNAASKASNQKQIFVLVIGETSRRDNWQLNHYGRKNNPELVQQKNLVNFNNMLSISNATRSSIPMMLTRKPASSVYTYNFPEKSVISVFKEVGFKTYWLSNQQKFGTFDTSTSVYAKEADQMFFLNKANYTEAGTTDDVLIPALDRIMSQDGSKKFIVIHTLGSHYNYAHRYPSRFDVFRPSLGDLKNYSLQSKKNKEELINSYDNSILFTDYVLSQFIKKLQAASDTESFLFYSSDHGEDLFDQGCDKSGHGNATKHNFEIAAFAWYSDLFAINHPEKVNKLRQNQNAKISQMSIFPTLVEAASIYLPDDPLSKSVTGDFVPYPRLVLGTKDYDQIEPKGICADI